MKLRALPFVLLAALLLAGCDIEPAAYLIEGGDHSLTVERRKPYPWSSGWQIDLVVARYPDCQRRYPLKKAGDKKFRVDLYRTQTGAFVLNQASRWYIAETRECRMQQYEQEPPEPGEYLGAFRVKNEIFVFVPHGEDANGKAKAAAK